MTLTLSRDFFVPAAAVKVADKQSDAVAFVYNDMTGRPCARVFFGKQSKPVWACYFRTAAAREASIVRAFEGRRATLKAKADRKADRKANATKFEVGQILSTCWGYEQTNREFYEVVRVKGSAVTVREIATETIATGYMTARVIPLPGAFVGEELRRMAGGYGLKISSCQRATPHDFDLVAGVKVYRAVSTSSYH